MRIGVTGCMGRMGSALTKAIFENDAMELMGAFEQNGNPSIGQDAGKTSGFITGTLISTLTEEKIQACDVVIDFTRPEGSILCVEKCLVTGTPIVIGTTGFTTEEKSIINEAGKKIGIVLAPNMSVGINLVFSLVELAAKVVGTSFDAEVIEAHHRDKIDSPSGTALRIGQVIAEASGRSLEKNAVYERLGRSVHRESKEIGFATVRGGDIIGDHTALFAGDGERIEITHRASSRTTFVNGALKAATFLVGKDAGVYDMRQVLGLGG